MNLLFENHDVSAEEMQPNKLRILIVEKHNAVRRALAIRLRVVPQFQVVGTVTMLSEALEVMEARAVDVVLLGIQSGTGRSPDQAVESVLQLAELSDVVVLAPYSNEEQRVALLRAGAKRYLLKHIDSGQLIHEIEGAVES